MVRPNPEYAKSVTNSQILIVTLGLFVAPTIACAYYGDYVLSALFGITGVTALFGGRRGAAKIVSSLFALAVGIACAPKFAPMLEPKFTEQFGTTGLGNRILCLGIVGFGIWLILSWFINLLTNAVIKSVPQLDTANRWFGLLVGAVQGFVAAVLFIGGMLILEPAEAQRAADRDPNDAFGQYVSKTVLTVAEQTRASKAGPLFEEYNPFERIPRLQKIKEAQETIEVLQKPHAMDKLIQSPEAHKFLNRPEIRRALSQLETDEDVIAAIQGGKSMDMSTVRMLLKHPVILELFEQPGIMEDATELLHKVSVTDASQSLTQESATATSAKDGI